MSSVERGSSFFGDCFMTNDNKKNPAFVFSLNISDRQMCKTTNLRFSKLMSCQANSLPLRKVQQAGLPQCTYCSNEIRCVYNREWKLIGYDCLMTDENANIHLLY